MAGAMTLGDFLADLGVLPEGRDPVPPLPDPAEAQAVSVKDAEAAFAIRRSASVEIHVYQDLLSGAPDDERLPLPAQAVGEELRSTLWGVDDLVRTSLGVDLPQLVLVPSADLPIGGVAVKINDETGPIGLGPGIGQIAVTIPVEEVEALGVAATRGHLPSGDDPLSIVTADEAKLLEAAGHTPLTPVAFVGMVVALEVTRLAYRLLSVDDVDQQLALLDQLFPSLIAATLAHYTSEEVTRILRELLRKRRSIGNLRAILEYLLAHDIGASDDQADSLLDAPAADATARGDGTRSPAGYIAQQLDRHPRGGGMNLVEPRLRALLPEGWSVTERITLIAPDQRANVVASSDIVSPETDSRRYAVSQAEPLAKEMPGYQEESFEEIQLLGGRRGFARTLLCTPHEGPIVRQFRLYCVENGRAYTITASASVSDWNAVKDRLLQVVDGITVRMVPT